MPLLLEERRVEIGELDLPGPGVPKNRRVGAARPNHHEHWHPTVLSKHEANMGIRAHDYGNCPPHGIHDDRRLAIPLGAVFGLAGLKIQLHGL